MHTLKQLKHNKGCNALKVGRSTTTKANRVAGLLKKSPIQASRVQKKYRNEIISRANSDTENDAAGSVNDEEFMDYAEENVELDWKAKLFGTYLQIGVWVVVLSIAGIRGFGTMLQNADGAQDVGLLVVPTSAALFLMASFLTYRFVLSNKDK